MVVPAGQGSQPVALPGSGIAHFSAASAEAKDAIVALLAEHGVRERFRFDTGGVLRSIMWDSTIINHSSAEVARKLGAATSSIGLVAEDPEASARHAAEFLRSRGFQASVVLDAEPGLPIAFVLSDAMAGTVVTTAST
jgi:hypothetical protein